MQYEYVLNIEGLKAGSTYVLNREYALNKGMRRTPRVYGTLIEEMFILKNIFVCKMLVLKPVVVYKHLTLVQLRSMCVENISCV